MRVFDWVSRRVLPPVADLRRCGWDWDQHPECPAPHRLSLIDAGSIRLDEDRIPVLLRPRMIALNLQLAADRAKWLTAGFGDVLATQAPLDELAERARRVWGSAIGPFPQAPGPEVRLVWQFGPLALDLVKRDARIGARSLHLNPREFGLLWYLGRAGGANVTRRSLLRDVWGIDFEPGTNTVAVHICRLRIKLRAAGVDHLLVTGPGASGYALDCLAPAMVRDTLDGAMVLRNGGPFPAESSR